VARAKTVKAAAKKKPAAKTAKATPAKASKSVFDQLEPLPTNAWGLTRVPHDFASSERAATLLGLGYPHIILPSTEAFTGTDDALYKRQDARVIPRNALDRLYRAHTARAVRKGELQLASEVEIVLQHGGPYVVWLLEAMFGSEPMARAFVERLDSYPVSVWETDGQLENYGWMMIRMFGYTLWRVPASVRTELRGQLEALFGRVSAGLDRPAWSRPIQALDLILHGRVGAERCGRGYNGKLHLSELHFADDDPAWIAERVLDKLTTLRPADREFWDIQLAVLGGPTVLAALKANTKCFKADQKKSIETQLSLVES
jgi:hypothetical protein